MGQEIRVRFAPSPTGQVHIGNIRAAIFNWLYARRHNGKFLLRIEDTDQERSTPQAIDALLEVMDWLGLNYDEEPLYQSKRQSAHEQAAHELLEQGYAYYSGEDHQGQAIVFRIPWDCDHYPFIQQGEEHSIQVHPDFPITIHASGVTYALPDKNQNPVPQRGCLAGFWRLKLWDQQGHCCFALEPHDIPGFIQNPDRVKTIPHVHKISFQRRYVHFHDLVKGDLVKPLDSLKDFTILRSDRTPVFHLANVCDDIFQRITHIIRGDDHVENTFRHLFLFAAFKVTPPLYAHLPMIVNAQGKPYSKRDGDAYVGEFRDHGYLPDALFNYLTLLGWSPGDNREKMSRQELIEAFDLSRVRSIPSQMDLVKLRDLNGQYVSELPLSSFLTLVYPFLKRHPWFPENCPSTYLTKIAQLLQSRVKTLEDVAVWRYFFEEVLQFQIDEKVIRKAFNLPNALIAIHDLCPELEQLPEFSATYIEQVIHRITERHGIPHGKLNLPIRICVTGTNTGAGLYETMEVLGKEKTIQNIKQGLSYIQKLLAT